MAFEGWMIPAVANAFIVVIYGIIAYIMIRGIAGGHQWRSNPIAVATAGVFVSCAVGHGLHLLHVIPPLSILEPAEAAAARAMFSDPRLLVWDGITGVVAIAYFTLRKRLAIVYQGASLNEDVQERQRQASLIQTRIVAGLDDAQAFLDAGDRDAALKRIDHALDEGKDVITMLLGRPGTRTALSPGDLRREAPSD